jgi:hypothetical protein
LAAAASFGVGWGVAIAQPIAHAEGGSGVSIAPAVTYLISETGVVFVFGSGAILLGLALIVLMLGSGLPFPTWLRWFTWLAALCGIAGLAFFTFFVLLIWALAVGIWLLSTGRTAEASPPAPCA